MRGEVERVVPGRGTEFHVIAPVRYAFRVAGDVRPRLEDVLQINTTRLRTQLQRSLSVPNIRRG
jgi:hypothetical protein